MEKYDEGTNWYYCGHCLNTEHIILYGKSDKYVKCKNCGCYGKIMPSNAYKHIGFELHI